MSPWNDVRSLTKCGNLHYTITYYVIWANQKTEFFKYHRLRALAMFDVTSFPAILSGIGHHFKFCRYVNCLLTPAGDRRLVPFFHVTSLANNKQFSSCHYTDSSIVNDLTQYMSTDMTVKLQKHNSCNKTIIICKL